MKSATPKAPAKPTQTKGKPTSTRQKREPAPPQRGRISEALRAPSPYPGFIDSLAVGARIVGSSPVLLVVPLLFVAASWLVFLALGIDQFPQAMPAFLALPPVSTIVDASQVAQVLFLRGSPSAFVFPLITTAIRALLVAIMAGWVYDVARFGRASLVGLLRGLQAFPAVLGVYLFMFAVLVGTTYFTAFFGQILQLMFPFFLLASLVLLVFAPFVAVVEGSSVRTAIRKSVRAAFLPGSRHLLLALSYFLLALIAIQAIHPTGDSFTVNPSWLAWVVVFAMNFVHLVFFAAFGFRYMVVEPIVPDEPLSFGRGRQQTSRRRR
jgi:hypothetical protein